MRVDEIHPGHLYRVKHQPPREVLISAVGPIVYVPDARHDGTVSRAGGTPKAAGLSVHGRWMYWTADGPADHVATVLIYSLRAEFDPVETSQFMSGWFRAVRSTALLDHLAEHGFTAGLDATGAVTVPVNDLVPEQRAMLVAVLATWTWPQSDAVASDTGE